MSQVTFSPTTPMQCISVVGTTGSGKTTLARALADCLDLPYVELDALNWGPDWTQVPKEVFRQRVTDALGGDVWVADGNYSSRVRDIIWARADTIVWLDYALPLIMWRLFRRSLRRGIIREELWSGNRESLRAQFLSRDSLFLWALKTYKRRRQQVPETLMQPAYQHLRLVHLRTPQQARMWLASVQQV